jgi:copper homeostasis protein
MDPPFLFEACVDSTASAACALAGGAGRLELCEALVEGGVTPSHGKIAAVVRLAKAVPVHVLIRPRPGDFVYSAEELMQMVEDIEHCKQLGAAGIVSGALLPDGTVDIDSTRALIVAARPLKCVGRRAGVGCASLVLECGTERMPAPSCLPTPGSRFIAPSTSLLTSTPHSR